jgi:glutamine synthetase
MAEKRPTGMLSAAELRQLVAQDEIQTVLAVFPDLYGRLVGKRITGHFFCEEILQHGMHACDYLFACDMDMDPVPGYRFTSWAQGYGDVHCTPDPSTLRRAAWLDRTALVLCDAHDPVTVAPRTILKRQMEAAAAQNLRPMGGSELEFFAFRETYDGAQQKHFEDLQPFGWYVEDYHTLQGTKIEGLNGAIRRLVDASGVPVEFSKGEWGPGQQEINLRYADFLEMADRHVIYKQAAKEIALRQGLAITFMAKVDERYAGSSMHLHSSLWSKDKGQPLFAGEGPSIEGKNVQLPDAFRWWLGGLMRHGRACALLFAPYVNSYKRFRAGSFAPTGIAWSYDNRTAGFRVVGRGPSLRVECRIPGADANPYLAFAATLAAGLDGLANRIEPPPMFRGDVYAAKEVPTVPTTLPEAIAEFERAELFRRAFGEAVVEHLVHFARTEQRKFEEAVTSWERRRYFERG